MFFFFALHCNYCLDVRLALLILIKIGVGIYIERTFLLFESTIIGPDFIRIDNNRTRLGKNLKMEAIQRLLELILRVFCQWNPSSKHTFIEKTNTPATRFHRVINMFMCIIYFLFQCFAVCSIYTIVIA